MRIRHDSPFISSVLFTVALLWLVPWCWQDALAARHLEMLDAPRRGEAQALGQMGVASLGILAVGLIVTWRGYAKRVSWTWIVMAIIVGAWAYPLLLIRIILHNLSIAWLTEIVRDAVYDRAQLPRTLLQMMFIFILMLVALILPLRSFMRHGQAADAVKSH